MKERGNRGNTALLENSSSPNEHGKRNREELRSPEGLKDRLAGALAFHVVNLVTRKGKEQAGSSSSVFTENSSGPMFVNEGQVQEFNQNSQEQQMNDVATPNFTENIQADKQDAKKEDLSQTNQKSQEQPKDSITTPNIVEDDNSTQQDIESEAPEQINTGEKEADKDGASKESLDEIALKYFDKDELVDLEATMLDSSKEGQALVQEKLDSRRKELINNAKEGMSDQEQFAMLDDFNETVDKISSRATHLQKEVSSIQDGSETSLDEKVAESPTNENKELKIAQAEVEEDVEDRRSGIKADIMNSPELRPAYESAQEIAKLRDNSFVEGSQEFSENAAAIKDKEDKLNDLLIQHRDGLDDLPDGPKKDAEIRALNEATMVIIDATTEKPVVTDQIEDFTSGPRSMKELIEQFKGDDLTVNEKKALIGKYGSEYGWDKDKTQEVTDRLLKLHNSENTLSIESSPDEFQIARIENRYRGLDDDDPNKVQLREALMAAGYLKGESIDAVNDGQEIDAGSLKVEGEAEEGVELASESDTVKSLEDRQSEMPADDPNAIKLGEAIAASKGGVFDKSPEKNSNTALVEVLPSALSSVESFSLSKELSAELETQHEAFVEETAKMEMAALATSPGFFKRLREARRANLKQPKDSRKSLFELTRNAWGEGRVRGADLNYYMASFNDYEKTLNNAKQELVDSLSSSAEYKNMSEKDQKIFLAEGLTSFTVDKLSSIRHDADKMIDEKRENRSGFKKVLAKLGKRLNTGSLGWRMLKYASAPALVGAGLALVPLSGALLLPVAGFLGIGGSFAGRSISKAGDIELNREAKRTSVVPKSLEDLRGKTLKENAEIKQKAMWAGMTMGLSAAAGRLGSAGILGLIR